MEIEIKPEIISKLFNFPITNSLITEWLAILIIFCLGLYLKKKIDLIPQSYGQNILEILIEEIRNFIETIFEKNELQRKIFGIT